MSQDHKSRDATGRDHMGRDLLRQALTSRDFMGLGSGEGGERERGEERGRERRREKRREKEREKEWGVLYETARTISRSLLVSLW